MNGENDKIETIGDIDTNTPEGNLLLMATIKYSDDDKEPDEVLAELNDFAALVENEKQADDTADDAPGETDVES